LLTVILGGSWSAAQEFEIPKATEAGAEVALVVREPDLVTPVAVAVDDDGQVYVVESQTHFRPEGYQGPERDRIRRVGDADQDGIYEPCETVFEGTTHTMGLAIEADGALLVVTRSELFRLRRDRNGAVTTQEPLARLETEEAYPHNGLSGVAVDVDGTIYLGMGENMGRLFALVGRDGRRLEGAGEGGSVFRLRPDGSGLERWATGFWNPFHLAFDAYGRLFVVDNDPDSRPPCRLIHVVEGGEYGFRFRHGRRGVNPFTSWNGEIVGTLPMAAGTGEAPSGIAVIGHEQGLPWFAVTSWGDHRVERHRMIRRGASFGSRRDDLVQGGVWFRPVGVAVGPDGSLFVSDWVSRSYPIHGLGRLWRWRPGLAERQDVARARQIEVEARRLAADPAGRGKLLRRAIDPQADPEQRAAALRGLDSAALTEVLPALLAERAADLVATALRRGPGGLSRGELAAVAQGSLGSEAATEALRWIDGPEAEPIVREALASDDPFRRHAARRRAIKLWDAEHLETWLRSPETPPLARAELLVALRERNPAGHDAMIRRGLEDVDPAVRLVALQWAYEERRTGLRDELEACMRITPVGERLFAAYLLAIRGMEAGRELTPEDDRPPAAELLRLGCDPSLPAEVRRLAVRLLPTDLEARERAQLEDLLDDRVADVRLEAIWAVASLESGRPAQALKAIAADSRRSAAERAAALAGLTAADGDEVRFLITLAGDASKVVARQAARGLRGVALDPMQEQLLQRDGLSALLDPAGHPWPLNRAVEVAAEVGDPAEGERVFFHPKGPGCYRCHRVDGRGGRIGPDLTAFGRESGRQRLVQSLLRPSDEVSPQFTAWRLAMNDGRLITGQMLGERGDLLLMADETGRSFTVLKDEIEEQTALATSVMPQDLARSLTREEFRDLIAYLMDPGAARQGQDPNRAP
jgi:putative membrane-bound dehydrogenase-like protein